MLPENPQMSQHQGDLLGWSRYSRRPWRLLHNCMNKWHSQSTHSSSSSSAVAPPSPPHLGVTSQSADLQSWQRRGSRKDHHPHHFSVHFPSSLQKEAGKPQGYCCTGSIILAQLMSISAEPFCCLSLDPNDHGRGALQRNLLAQRQCRPQAGHHGWRDSKTSLCQAPAALVGRW